MIGKRQLVNGLRSAVKYVYRHIHFDTSKFSVQNTGSGLYVTLLPTKTSISTTTTPMKKPFDFGGLNSYTPPTDSSSQSSNSEDDYDLWLENNAGNYVCRILGSQYLVSAGDNVTWDGANDRWLVKLVPAGGGAYIYLKMDRKNLTVELVSNSLFPEFSPVAGDHIEYISYKLLYIWDGDPFLPYSLDDFIDARQQYEIEGMM